MRVRYPVGLLRAVELKGGVQTSDSGIHTSILSLYNDRNHVNLKVTHVNCLLNVRHNWDKQFESLELNYEQLEVCIVPFFLLGTDVIECGMPVTPIVSRKQLGSRALALINCFQYYVQPPGNEVFQTMPGFQIDKDSNLTTIRDARLQS